jgi:hypothetical protein
MKACRGRCDPAMMCDCSFLLQTEDEAVRGTERENLCVLISESHQRVFYIYLNTIIIFLIITWDYDVSVKKKFLGLFSFK